MRRYSTAAVLAFVATLALGLTTTPSASASASATATLFEAEGNFTVLTGTSHDNVFTAGTGGSAKFECTMSVFSGVVENNAETINLDATYTGKLNETPHGERCTGLGSPLITMNGCGYTIDGETVEEHAPAWIICPEGKEITIDTTLGCTIHIPPQTPTEGGLTFENKEEADGDRDVLATATATGIAYTATGGFCSLAGLHEENDDGNYTGTLTIKGYNGEGGPINGDEFIEGEQVDIEVTESESGDTLSAPGEDVSLVGEATGAEDFSLNAGTAECSESAYKGTLAVFPASQLTLSVELAGCEAFGYANTEVQTNGCHYLFHEGPETEEEGVFEGTADIECPEGETIEIVAKVRGLLKCRVTIGTQTGVEGVTYSNGGEGSERDIKISLELEGVKYTQHTGEGLGKCSSGSFEDGKVTGAPTVIGEDVEKEQVGIWVQATVLPTLQSEIEHTTLIGEDTGQEEIELEAGLAECLEAGYKGTTFATAQLVWELWPEFANCEAFGFSTAEVTWNECFYRFIATEEEGEAFEGKAAIVCGEGKAIEVIAKSGETLKCRATIGSQSGLTAATYTNSGSGSSRHIGIDLNLTGIAYTQDPGEGAGKCEEGSFENGKIAGSPTVIGENTEKEQVGIWVE